MALGIIIFIIFFLLLALARLDLALFCIIAGLPTYLIRFSVFGLPGTILETMILISFAVWFFSRFLPHLKSLIKNRKERIPYPFSWEIILLIILAFAAVGVAGFSNGALGIWKAYFFEPILLFILIFNIFQEKKDWSKIFWALLISALGISLIAIYQKITGQFIFNEFWANEATRRVVSWFGYPNAIGLYLAPLIMLFLGWFFSLPRQTVLHKSLQKILIILTIAGSVLAIYFARSEGALIGLAAGLFIFGMLAGRKQRIATLILGVIIVGGIFSSTAARNFSVSKLTLNDLSGQIRQRQWKETFLALRGIKLLTGAGLNNYQAAVKPYHQEGIFFNSDNLANFDEQLRASAELRAKYWQPVEIYLYPHNIFLNFWSELGLLGALVFTWLIIKYLFISLNLSIAFSREKKPEKYLALGLLSAMVVIIIHGLVDVPYFKNDLSALFWIFFALVGALNFNQKYGSKNIRS
jgi:O-antigen ligase